MDNVQITCQNKEGWFTTYLLVFLSLLFIGISVPLVSFFRHLCSSSFSHILNKVDDNWHPLRTPRLTGEATDNFE
jgi:hypothetical protein